VCTAPTPFWSVFAHTKYSRANTIPLDLIYPYPGQDEYPVLPCLVVMSTEIRATSVVDRSKGAAAALPWILHRLGKRCHLSISQWVSNLPKCKPSPLV
jgi:hypothetical protein